MKKLLLNIFICTPLTMLPIAAGLRPMAQNSQPGASEQKPGPSIGSPEEEILRRAEIRHAEDLHKEMLERADETALLAERLLVSFKKSNSLGREEMKKLDRMEKLARKIRGGTGGSDDEEGLEHPPVKLEEAVTRLAELSDTLKKNVRKTSRLVISASVINNSNRMIALIRHIRSLQKP